MKTALSRFPSSDTPVSHTPLPAAASARTTPAAAAPSLLYRRDDELSLEEDIALRRLLRLSFPFRLAFLRRRYRHGMPPQHRWLIRNTAGDLIAHAAAYDRCLATENGALVTVGGIAEACVHPLARRQGLLKRLLEEVHASYTRRGIAFCMLFGAARLYGSSGYQPIANRLLMRGLPFGLNPFHGTPMIRPLRADACWPDGTLDLCGPPF